MTITDYYNYHYPRACSKSSSRVCTRAFLRSPKLRVAQAVARSRLFEDKEQTKNNQFYIYFIPFYTIGVFGNLMNLLALPIPVKEA